MRPIQQHRVIKEVLHSHETPANLAQHQRPMLNPQQLTPLIQHMNLGGNMPNVHHHPMSANHNKLMPYHGQGKFGGHNAHGNQLPRIENSSDKEQINNLQQRVKDLEKENFKLQHHVQQAEQSIRNYRDILQAHNITNLNLPNNTTNKENKVNSKSQSSISAPTVELPSVLIKPSVDVELLRSQHQQELRILREQFDKSKKDLERSLQSLRIEKEEQSNLAAELQKKLRQLEEISKQKQELLQKQLLEKEQQFLTKATEHDQLNNLQHQLQEQLRQILAAQPKSPSPKKKVHKVNMEELVPELKEIQRKTHALHSQYCQLKQNTTDDFAALKHFCHQSIQLVVRRCKELLQHKEIEVERLKIDHDTSIISYMEQIEDLSSQLINAQGMRVLAATNRQDMGCSPVKQLMESPSKHLRLLEDQESSKISIAQLRKQLEDATLGVQGLQEVHGAEIKAVKHVAHIKELLRIAKEREQCLDRDRLQIELKHLKEVLNVLTFSLNTAEQSLVELQPQVVNKLIEGRNRRIQMLEQSYKGKLKDVEQRSAETCAVNTQHLEQFQKKAAENETTAKEITKAAANELIQLLRVSI